MVFSKEDKILIKNLQQLKGYTATHFLSLTRAQILTLLKRTVIQTYNSAKQTIFWCTVC